MEPTLSFSIINILGTETNNGELRKGSTLSSAMKKANASSSPPSDCPPYEHELHPHDTLEDIRAKDDVSDNETELDDGKASSHTRRPGRMRFTPAQIQALEKRFQKQHYLLPADRKFLAKSLHMTERQVKTWFQNKRAQYKRTRPLVRNPVYHHPNSPAPLKLSVPHLHLFPRPFDINTQVPGLAHLGSPTLCISHHNIVSSPSALSTYLPHLPMPMAYVPIPITPPNELHITPLK